MFEEENPRFDIKIPVNFRSVPPYRFMKKKDETESHAYNLNMTLKFSKKNLYSLKENKSENIKTF